MSYESVQEIFSRTAEKYGPQVAIERGNQHVSYAEVEAQSNRLANYLLDQGVSSGTICRSASSVCCDFVATRMTPRSPLN